MTDTNNPPVVTPYHMSIDEVEILLSEPVGFSITVKAFKQLARQYIKLHEENARLRTALEAIEPVLLEIEEYGDTFQGVLLLNTIRDALKEQK